MAPGRAPSTGSPMQRSSKLSGSRCIPTGERTWPCIIQFSSFRLPATRPKLKPRGTLHYSKITESWCLPFMGSDKSVMTRQSFEIKPSKMLEYSHQHPSSLTPAYSRTQRSFYHDKDQRLKAVLSLLPPILCMCRPTQIQAYLQLSSLFSALSLIFVGILFGILASFKLGRALLGGSKTLSHISVHVLSPHRGLSRPLLLWQSEQRWRSKGKGKQRSQM